MQFCDLYQVRSLQQTTTSEPLVAASLKEGGAGGQGKSPQRA